MRGLLLSLALLAMPLHAQEALAPATSPAPDLRPGLAPEDSPLPTPRPEIAVPTLHWDELRPGMDAPARPGWGPTLYRAVLAQEGLLRVVPEDIARWCPAYPDADPAQRAAFWAGLVSALSWHESTHSASAVGGGGRWFGLVQIAPATARARGCAVGTGEALTNGAANLRCAVRILSQNVERDGVVSAGMQGVAAEWGPFHTRRKREDMRDWVSSQDYCTVE
ncbi:transglycosylase SLT domain-containing protein [Nioella nitratireducens]|uniref:transglycosylase SLT domain-containing protein n=1 Tax=Nioella nitratireducens TaxID=1287720 RepID=UPI0008FD4C05|nr:transglycosylase SLT domain-containing protein [Nioella nitratireducens]